MWERLSGKSRLAGALGSSHEQRYAL